MDIILHLHFHLVFSLAWSMFFLHTCTRVGILEFQAWEIWNELVRRTLGAVHVVGSTDTAVSGDVNRHPQHPCEALSLLTTTTPLRNNNERIINFQAWLLWQRLS